MTIFLNNIKRILGKKSNLIVMFVVPIAFIIMVSSLANSGSKNMTIGVLDKDNTKFTEKLKDNLSQKYTIKPIEENTIKKSIIQGNNNSVIVIDKGFTESILKGDIDEKISMYSIKGVNNDMSFKYYLNSFVNSAKNIAKVSNRDKDKFYSGLDEYTKGKFTSQIKYTDGKIEKLQTSFSQIGFLIMSMLSLTTMITTLILRDKESGVYNRIFASGVKPVQYIFQCIVSFIVIALIQEASILIIMKKAFNSDLGPSPVSLFVVLAVFAVVCVALGTAICNASKDIKQANALIALVATPFCMLGGCFWPREIMGSALKNIGNFVPTTWAMEAANKIINGGTLMDVSKQIGIMAIFGVVFFIVAVVRRTNVAR